MFMDNYVDGDNVDWLQLKNDKAHFITNGRRRNYSDDFVGALLVRKIENEKGFDGVWEWLMTKRTKEEEEYFSVLNDLVGINKLNYNSEVTKLVKEEMNKFTG